MMTRAETRTAAATVEGARQTAPEVRARYESVIGLEVHVQLATKTKAFCACSTRFGDPPNTNTCPVCLGLPGALPVLNKRALELATRAALALHCTVQERSRFARKNYFYPDLAKGYQISQFELPLATGGWLEIESNQSKKRIGITRVHMEEDAAKNLHEGFADADRYSHVDFNRAGVPLIEIVGEPDLRAPEEAYAYLTNLKQALEYTAVSDCNMEEGSLRCDANVSVRLRGAEKFGTKVEVKNLNSFRYLQHALEYEIERQIDALEAGETVAQETRLWNVAAGRTESMRSKEFAHDYRYFPEPDLLPVRIEESWKEEIQRAMPELPDAKRARFVAQFRITPYDAGVLTASRALADYFEAVVHAGATPKAAANWIQTELLRRLNDAAKDISESPVPPRAFAELLRAIESNEITGASGKKVFAKMFETGQPVNVIINAEGLLQMSDPDQVEVIVRNAIEQNPENIATFRSGNEGVFKVFVGKVMQKTSGRANPLQVNRIVREQLKTNHEKRVAEIFVNLLNAETNQLWHISGAGLPPEPDVLIAPSANQADVGLEVTSTYISQSEAQFVWDSTIKTFLASPNKSPSAWSSGVISAPDKEYERRLYEAVHRKLKKQYSTPETWLVVEFNFWLGDQEDAEAIVSTVSHRLQGETSPFKSIWALWQVTNVIEPEYKIFRMR
ncbi:MAG: Asp-tRNA(Asn)/Glu-tRNA(Gln) amidotransferase subunit GatB [Candidatus Acidiferrales bacterium]